MILPDPPRSAPLVDEIMDETRERKESYAAEHGFDVGAIIRDARRKAVDAGVELTHRAARPAGAAAPE